MERENFNIVKIIDNSKKDLSDFSKNKLIGKIKDNFNEDEQKLYIASFYSFLSYNEYEDFVINFDDIWSWLDFSNKASAKRVLLRNFKKNENYKILEENDKKNGSGGHNKEDIILNINTFKLLCLISGTKKAKTIHTYYVKLENILHKILQEESVEFKNQIQQLQIDNDKLHKDNKLERHKILLKEYGISSIPIIYIIKVKTLEENSYIIKIGESRKGLSLRFSEHKSNYEECVILDCFKVYRSKDFESFLHCHEKIKPSNCKTLNNHKNEKELFLIGKELTYENLLKIIKKNIDKYNDINHNSEIEKLRLENEKLKLQINNSNDNNKNTNIINFDDKKIIERLDKLEKTNSELLIMNKQILEKLNNIQTKNEITTGFGEINKNVGNRIQKINPESGKLIKYYENIAEILKNEPTLKRSSLKKAIDENLIYNGFQWMEVNRESDPNVIINYKKPKNTKSQNKGYIAKLNKDKTQIINVYLDRKVACNENKYQSHSSLDNPVKNGTETRGHFYCLYNECDNDLVKTYQNKNGEVILYTNGIGKYDKKNNLIKEFTSKEQCREECHISDRVIKRVIENNEIYNDFYYKKLGLKIKHL